MNTPNINPEAYFILAVYLQLHMSELVKGPKIQGGGQTFIWQA